MTFSIFQRFCLALTLLVFTVLPNPAQQADTGFGTGGFVNTGFGGGNPFGLNHDRAVKAFYLPDGKILVVANHRHNPVKSFPSNTMRLFRYTNAGVPDTPTPTIPNSGTIGSRYNFVATDAAMQPDGKIVVVGYTFQNPENETGQDWAIARYNQDGTPDMVGGVEWYITRDFGNNVDITTDVELQPDGKIVVLGTSFNQTSISLKGTVARYNPDATPDSSFGSNGEGYFQLQDVGSLSKRLAIQSDGKLVLAGNTPPNDTTANVWVARLNVNGTFDTTFDGDGILVVNNDGQEILNDLRLQPDGKILVLFDSNVDVTCTPQNVRERISVLARFNPNGSKDLSFTPKGAVFINTTPSVNFGNQFGGNESWQSIILRNNGNIYISGSTVQYLISDNQRRNVYGVLEYSASGQLLNKNFSRHTRSEQVVSLANTLPFYVAGSIEQPDGKILLYGAHSESGGTTYNVSLARYLSVSAIKDANMFFDYNFDNITEYVVYRPHQSAFGTWHFLNGSQYYSRDFGLSSDILAPGDYDGDGMQDLAVFRPATGVWLTKKVNTFGCTETVQFGASGDIPAPGDFDGDGKYDRAVFRPSGGDWYILFSSGGDTAFHFGLNGDKPVVGDYDGDGKSDAAVIRRENGKMFWYILQSSDNQFVGLQFGITEDKTVVADYNGDGKTDIAVWRPSNGTWYVLANYTDFSAAQFGAIGDIPEPADYDNDRKTDFAVFRPNGGVHYVLNSSNGSYTGVQFGAATDVPIASAYVR
ncbi:MAG TPA: FG-GAP-like repeat-containing protein [Pyrinomonadaceae bacterium]|jgi:uncharacterized delta-60 repeat protein